MNFSSNRRCHIVEAQGETIHGRVVVGRIVEGGRHCIGEQAAHCGGEGHAFRTEGPDALQHGGTGRFDGVHLF